MPETAPIVQAVRDLGIQFQPNHVDITGQDGAASIVLGGGRSFWIFGDSVEGAFESVHDIDLGAVFSSTASIVPDQNPADGIRDFRYLTADDGRARQIVPFEDDEPPARFRIWPIHGIVVGDRIYLYYHKIELLPVVTVIQHFELAGMGLARADTAAFEFTRLRAPDGTREFWKENEPSFGVFVDRDESFVYLWGALKNEGRDEHGSDMYLARVAPADIERLDRYEYLVEAPRRDNPSVEPRWSREFSREGYLFGSVPNEMSCSFNAHLNRYVAFHTIGVTNRFVVRTADRITGPWSDPQVFHAPPPLKPETRFNALKEHSELARDGGRVLYLTYVDTNDYLPRLLEVVLA